MLADVQQRLGQLRICDLGCDCSRFGPSKQEDPLVSGFCPVILQGQVVDDSANQRRTYFMQKRQIQMHTYIVCTMAEAHNCKFERPTQLSAEVHSTFAWFTHKSAQEVMPILQVTPHQATRRT